MNEITPIGNQKQQEVVDETLRYIYLASTFNQKIFESIDVEFNLKGQASGAFCVNGSDTIIRYNPFIFSKHYAYCFANTIPHEVAHYVIYCIYGLRGARPHGAEWKEVMQQFGVEPRRTNALDLTGVPIRRQQRHPYRCSCSDHQVSTRRHNQIRSGKSSYTCRSCSGKLVINRTNE